MTGRRERGKRFALIPAEVIHSPNWAQASKPCRALLADMAVQYSGFNNGDLTASITVMGPLGWEAPETLVANIREAEHYGFLVKTKQGGLGIGPSLYALGWQRIDACNDPKTRRCKLDEPTLVGTMPSGWRTPKPKFQRSRKNKTPLRHTYQAATSNVAGRVRAATSNVAAKADFR
jgi:hypothetical protein